MNLIGRLQTVSDRYCAAAGLRREQVSYQVFRDQRRLESVFVGGAGLTVANFEKAMAWFSANWPVGLGWPEGVERPHVNEADGLREGDGVARAVSRDDSQVDAVARAVSRDDHQDKPAGVAA